MDKLGSGAGIGSGGLFPEWVVGLVRPLVHAFGVRKEAGAETHPGQEPLLDVDRHRVSERCSKCRATDIALPWQVKRVTEAWAQSRLAREVAELAGLIAVRGLSSNKSAKGKQCLSVRGHVNGSLGSPSKPQM